MSGSISHCRQSASHNQPSYCYTLLQSQCIILCKAKCQVWGQNTVVSLVFGCVWLVCGLCVACVWPVFGLCVGSVWVVCGQ